jgi:hypothetical protein
MKKLLFISMIFSNLAFGQFQLALGTGKPMNDSLTQYVNNAQASFYSLRCSYVKTNEVIGYRETSAYALVANYAHFSNEEGALINSTSLLARWDIVYPLFNNMLFFEVGCALGGKMAVVQTPNCSRTIISPACSLGGALVVFPISQIGVRIGGGIGESYCEAALVFALN